MRVLGLTSIVIDFDSVLRRNDAQALDPDAVTALRTLDTHLYLSVRLVTEPRPDGTCWSALHAAGVSDLVQGVLDAHPLDQEASRPFWEHLLADTGGTADQVMIVSGDRAAVTAANTIGMHAALVGPPGKHLGAPPLPDGALLIQHIRDLPGILTERTDHP